MEVAGTGSDRPAHVWLGAGHGEEGRAALRREAPDREGLREYRDAYCATIRAFHARARRPAPGRCGTSSGTPRSTRWITPGRWKTRT